jgi:hypothetical protein
VAISKFGVCVLYVVQQNTHLKSSPHSAIPPFTFSVKPPECKPMSNKLEIINESGSVFHAAGINFIDQHNLDGKVGGTIEVHGSPASEGIYDCPTLKMKILLKGKRSNSTLWNFSLQELYR